MTSRGRFYIFANPAACGGLTRERHAILKRLANRLGGEILGPETNNVDEFLDLVELTVRDGDWVVFAGGDGTLHDGLNSVYGLDVTVGYIPFGTGNAAAYALSISKSGASSVLGPPDEERLFEILSRGKVKKVDLVRVTTPLLPDPEVGLFASVGWCAMIANQRDGQGLLGYLGPAMKNIVGEFYEQDTTVIIDGRNVWSGLNTFVVVSKSQYYGAGVVVVPDAVLDDGFLHLAIYHLSRTEMATMYAKSFVGFTPQPDVARPGRRVKIQSEYGELPLQIDGEYIGLTEEVLCEVLPSAIKIVTGELMADSHRRRPTMDGRDDGHGDGHGDGYDDDAGYDDQEVKETGKMGSSLECGHCQHAILGGEVFRCTKCNSLYHAHCWQNYSKCSNGNCGSVICDIVRVATRKKTIPDPVFILDDEDEGRRSGRSGGAYDDYEEKESLHGRRGEKESRRSRGGGDERHSRCCRQCGSPIDSFSLPCPFCGSMP